MGNYASKGDSYTKNEIDSRYTPIGTSFTKKESDTRYSLTGTSYTREESDGMFQPKGNYSIKGESYTKTESDSLYAPFKSVYTKQESDGKFADKTELANFSSKTEVLDAIKVINDSLQPKGNYALVGSSYTKEEDDARYATFATKKELNDAATLVNNTFQPKGNYALSGVSYTKQESDTKYAPAGTSYTKAEDDTRYALFATKKELNDAATLVNNTFQPKGNYALVGASYTKAEDDARFAPIGSSYTKAEDDARFAPIGSAYTKSESDSRLNTAAIAVNSKIDSLVSTNTLNDLKPRTMWCADGDFCTIPKKGGDLGGVMINNGHIGYSNTLQNGGWKSEISNDTTNYKKLMIIGNKSNDANGPRRVGVWDRLDVHGDLGVDNDIIMGPKTIRSTGRLHVFGEELLYLLNKNGVIIGREWGGNGNLQVQGGLWVQGRDILAELNQCVKVGDPIAIRSGRQGGRGLVQGSDQTNVYEWEQLRIERR